MAVIFARNRGSVVRLDDPTAQATIGFVQVKDAPIRYNQEWAIITRLTLSHQVNVQFLHTLGSAIYIYVFGDRIGQLGLSGLAFNAKCNRTTSGKLLGIERMMNWYKENRVSARGSPVRVMVGSTPIEGFVISSTEDTIDAETGLVQWGVNMQVLPEAPSRLPAPDDDGLPSPDVEEVPDELLPPPDDDGLPDPDVEPLLPPPDVEPLPPRLDISGPAFAPRGRPIGVQ